MKKDFHVPAMAGLLFFFSSFLSAYTQYEVGNTAGQFVVEQGAASYSVPVFVPPGTAGVVPDLKFTYNSQSASGILGVGWSVQGLSSIQRCATTLAQDGFIDGVDYDENDRFCLDGQRLVVVNDLSYGSAGAEYRTEIDTYARITSHGSQGTGPAYFVVETKAGQTIEYGVSAGSRIEAQGQNSVAVWAASKISDAKGNYLEIRYSENPATGEYYPSGIDYTGNNLAGLSPYNHVEFVYETRPDIVSGYAAGAIKSLTQRLTNIRSYADDQLVRDYRVQYETAPLTGKSRVISLQECSESGCYTPIRFEYQESSGVLVNKGAWVSGAYPNWEKASTRTHRIDVNGDGLQDIVLGPDANGAWFVMRSRGSDFVNEGAWITGAYANWNGERVHPMDVDADGMTDFVIGPDAEGKWYVLRSTGTSFENLGAWANTGYAGWAGATDRTYISDLDADGLPDIVLGPDAYGKWYVLHNRGDRFDDEHAWITGAYANWNGARVHPMEIDGDALPEFVIGPDVNGQWFVLQSDGKRFINDGAWVSGAYREWEKATNRTYEIDVNGDSLQDLAFGPDVYGKWYVMLSSGKSFVNQGAWINGAYANWSEATDRTYVIDVNLDGRSDFVFGPDTNGNWYQMLSTGSGFINKGVWLSGLYGSWGNAGSRIRSMEISGDGIEDIVIGPDANGKWYVLESAGAVPDLVTTMHTAPDLATMIEYKHLTDMTVYRRGRQQAELPPGSMDLQIAMPVVSGVSQDNGLGGRHYTSYFYEKLRMHLLGRGVLGFARVVSTDHWDNRSSVETYHQEFPLVLQVKSSETLLDVSYDAGSDLWAGQRLDISFYDNGYSYNQFTGVYALQRSGRTVSTYELDGQLIKTQGTVSNFDDYGNAALVISTVESTNGEYRKTINNTFENDIANWHLGRLVLAEVTSTAPDGQFQMRKSAFEYDPLTGLLKKEIIEPGSNISLNTEYEHDVFGNVRVTRQYGAEGEIRQAVTEYDARGQFPVLLTNALGHQEHYIYDGETGHKTVFTDSDGLVTRWQYDGFGRKVRETRPDGAESQWLYRWSTNCNLSVAVYEIYVTTTGSPDRFTCYDKLSREVNKGVITPDGRWIFTDFAYDANGRLNYQSRNRFQSDTPLWTMYLYDILGRNIYTSYPDGRVDEWVYEGLETEYIKDSHGQRQRTTEVRDVQNRLVSVTDSLYGTITYAYDPSGNLTDTWDAGGNHTSISYDARSRKTSTNDPDMGLWTYQYNAFGELIQQRDGTNRLTVMSYDKLGRMVSRTTDEGESLWEYDHQSVGFAGTGKLYRATSPEGMQRLYTYDEAGRLTKVTSLIDEDDNGVREEFFIATTYDSSGRIANRRFHTGFSIENRYDQYGYLLSVLDGSSEKVYWQANEYNADGKVTLEELGNGLTSVHLFDDYTGLLEQKLTGLGDASSVQFLAYQFDALGNLLKREDLNQELSETFTYDHMNRLLVSQLNGGQSLEFAYDATGNIMYRSDVGTYFYGADGGDPTAGPHAVTKAGDSTYRYDGNGNLVAGAGRNIDYNAFNKPVNISYADKKIAFSHDADNVRYRRDDYNNQQHVKTTIYLNPRIDTGLSYEKVITGSDVEHRHYINIGHHRLMRRLSEAHPDEDEDGVPNVSDNCPYNSNPSQQDMEGDGIGNACQGPVIQGHWLEKSGRRGSGYVLHVAGERFSADTRVYVDALLQEGVQYIDENHLAITYGAAPSGQLSVEEGAYSSLSPIAIGEALPGFYVQGFYSLDNDGFTESLQLVGSGFPVRNSDMQVMIGDTAVEYETQSEQTMLVFVPQGQSISGHISVTYENFTGSTSQYYGQRDALPIEPVTTASVRYLHTDHLGSTESITDETGVVVERLSYQPFGKRRNDDWTNVDGLLLTANITERGFTGHEQMDEIGLVHMNGRVYDPQLGRFLSPDPHIQQPGYTLSYDRYAYLNNNPLNATDPSGYFLKKLGRSVKRAFKNDIVRTIASIALSYYTYGLLDGLFIPGGSFTASAGAGFVSGAVSSGSLEGGLAGAGSALLFMPVNNMAGGKFGSSQWFRKTLAHGAAGGVQSELTGGKFQHGFLSAGFSQATIPEISNIQDGEVRIMAATVAGGITTELGGGKFANGAKTFGFMRLFQEMPDVYENLVHYELDINPGEGVKQKTEFSRPAEGYNNIGVQGLSIKDPCFLCEAGPVSRVANNIPGVNAVAGMHDVFQVSMGTTIWRDVLNVPGMVVAASVTYPGFIGRILNNAPPNLHVSIKIGNEKRDDNSSWLSVDGY